MDPSARKEAIERLRDCAKQRKTVVQTLEFAARVNREIGLNSDAPTGGIRITFVSNLQPGALRRRETDPAPNPRTARHGRDTKGGAA